MPQPSQPPIAGAVDLAALKNKPDEAQENQAIHEALTKLNLVCDCGNAIERGGQEIIVVVVGLVPTPNGPARGMNVNKRSFCSVSCQFFEMFKQAAVTQDTLLVVSRPLPTNFWFKRPTGPAHQTAPDVPDLHQDDNDGSGKPDPRLTDIGSWSDADSDPVGDFKRMQQQIYEES